MAVLYLLACVPTPWRKVDGSQAVAVVAAAVEMRNSAKLHIVLYEVQCCVPGELVLEDFEFLKSFLVSARCERRWLCVCGLLSCCAGGHAGAASPIVVLCLPH